MSSLEIAPKINCNLVEGCPDKFRCDGRLRQSACVRRNPHFPFTESEADLNCAHVLKWYCHRLNFKSDQWAVVKPAWVIFLSPVKATQFQTQFLQTPTSFVNIHFSSKCWNQPASHLFLFVCFFEIHHYLSNFIKGGRSADRASAPQLGVPGGCGYPGAAGLHAVWVSAPRWPPRVPHHAFATLRRRL